MWQLTLYPYEEFDFGVLVDEPLALPCLGIIGMPKFPSQPNKGVRLSFDAISNVFMFYVVALHTQFKSWRKLYWLSWREWHKCLHWNHYLLSTLPRVMHEYGNDDIPDEHKIFIEQLEH